MKENMPLKVEELDELFGLLDLNKPNTGINSKCSNLNLKTDFKSEDGCTSEGKANVTQGLERENDLPLSHTYFENGNQDPEVIPEPTILLKRGPQRTTRCSLHVATPYSNVNSEQHEEKVNNSNLLYSGGKIIKCKDSTDLLSTPESSISHAHKPWIPDFSQLLEDVCVDGTNIVINLQEKLPLEDEISETLNFFLSSDDPFPDLGTSDLFLNSPDAESDVTEPEIGHQTEEYHYSGNNNILIDKIPDRANQSLDDQFSPQSSDTGYTSDGTDYTSNVNSPPSSLSSLSPVYSSSVQPSSNFPISRPIQNPYFKDLDKDYCENSCKAILKKANEKDGLNQKDKYNRTLLHIAIQQKNEVYAIVMLNMLQKSFQNGTGSKTLPKFTDLSSFLNQEDDFGYTPLLLACMYNLPKILEYLLDCGASLSINHKFSYGSALHFVCKRGNRFYRIAEILCTKASSYINMQNIKQETPLHIAVGYHGIKHQDEGSKILEIVDNLSLIHLLLDKNARLNVQDVMGRTPLHWMAITNNFELTNIFSSKACDWKAAVNMQNIEGKTILHYAAQCTDIGIDKQKYLIHKLLACFASPLIMDSLGRFPKDLVPVDRREHLSVLSAYYFQDPQVYKGYFNVG